MKRRRVDVLFLLSWIVLTSAPVLHSAETARTVAIVTDPQPGRASRYAVQKLSDALRARGLKTETSTSLDSAAGDFIVLAGTSTGHGPAMQTLDARVKVPTAPESLAVQKLKVRGKPGIALYGGDDRGLMYALLDAADRAGWSATNSADPFSEVRDTSESPFIRDRSLSVYTMNRAHWESRFYDDHYWARYFDMMAANRFNRFLIVFGYENGGFLAPPYPYFFDTPGFKDVRMVDLTPEQQKKNLTALNHLIELAHDRGIAVSLGIWDHIYRAGVQTGGAEWLGEYKGRPVPNTVTGVTTENLNAYTLASLKELLANVPALDGIQFRMHEESGLKREEMDGFWRAVFQHVQKIKPGMLIEARAKGMPDSVIDTALALGVNLRIETKYWMEQMGLPFHPSHVNPPNQHDRRHGYADLLRYPQRYQMDWRLWNGGTTRVLLWADPEYVRRYSESTLVYDSPNWDVQEPLATKMEAQRPDMPTFALMPEKYRYYDYEFERYWHFFQVWGRIGYNPQTPADAWDHEFNKRFGGAGKHVEGALHRASQVLPMIVSAVYPYKLFPTTRGWAERQSLGVSLAEYAQNEGTDTAQFENFADAAKRIIEGGTTAKRTPDATSRWFDETADAILTSARAAESAIGDKRGREFDATMIDVRILSQLARFHARRATAAVHYNLFKRSQKPAELLAAANDESAAVAAWHELVTIAGDHYNFDLAMGARNFALCGHWRDELVKLESNLKKLEAQASPIHDSAANEKAWKPAATGDRTPPTVDHARIRTAHPGESLRITARVTDPSGVQSVRLRYRHLTQYEDYLTLDLQPSSKPNVFAASVPGDFLVPQWSFMYFLEVNDKAGNGANWPNFAQEMPYVVVKMEPK